MTVVIYTADCGAHDDVHLIGDQGGVECVRFDSDRRCIPTGTGWQSRPADVHPAGLPDRLAARWYKTHPHLLFPDAYATIWVDSCIEITCPSFAAQATAGLVDVAMFRHPDRDNVWDEIAAAGTLGKYDGNQHVDMVAVYEAAVGAGALAAAGLWAMTVIARRATAPAVAVDGLVWSETVRWSTPDCTALDQLIVPVALAGYGSHTPHVVDLAETSRGSLWNNPWFSRHPHRRDT